MSDITPAGFIRLERKLDQLTEAVSKLILIEERLMIQALRIAEIEVRQRDGEKERRAINDKVEKWINRGIGISVLAGVIFAAIGLAIKLIN